ncbi:MAG: hypothetical protein HY614_05090 [Candidatus Rokubacteria bacterium]|nr:hypothetical protein [Candidatus Rokubacteria bacterium]
MALAVVAKVAMLASGTHDGFLGCYRSPVASPPAALACEKSYENPFFRFGVTRVDHTVDFSGGNWDLSFINSLRFNIYPWVRGNVLRDRLPLAVTWEGIIEGSDPRMVRIVYVGEGTAGFGPLVVSLPPQYRTAAAVTVPVPSGRHRVRIDYKFDDGYRVGDGAFPGPYAVFGILDAAGHPLRARPPGWAWLVLANVIDGVIAVLLVALLVLYVRVLKGYTVIVGALGLVAALAWMVSREVVAQVVVPEALLLVVASFLVLAFTRRHRSRHVIAAYFGCFAASVLRARLDFGALGAVLYQPAGDDWLTYESFARSILESWSLEAGEPVFYYQPLFRYLRFVEHFVIGDGDALIAVCALALLNFALFWLIGFVWPRSRSIRARVVVVASALLLAIVLNSDSVVGLLNVGASEYPTWIALLFGVPMLVRSERPRHLVLGTLLAVGSLLMRLNQAPGWLALLALALLRAGGRRRAIVMGVIVLAGVALPAAHNAYYGGRLVLTTTSGQIPTNLVLPPRTVFQAAYDRGARAAVSRQVRSLFFLEPHPRGALWLGFHGLQLVWVVSAVALLASPKERSLVSLGLIAVPMVFLAVHLFYQVGVYYPRHIVIGHVAMGVACCVAGMTRGGGRGRGAGERPPAVRSG